MNPKVDEYLSKVEKWREELARLRSILLGCMLTEELKWGQPCYTFNNSNIAIIGGLKDYCVLSFFQGVLLSDPSGILVKPGEETQTVRLIPLTGVGKIAALEPTLKAYIYEAIEVEKAGLKADLTKSRNIVFPQEFQNKLNLMPALKSAFEQLTPGRQRGYNLYFSAPKQSKTRAARVEKCIPQILRGKGLND